MRHFLCATLLMMATAGASEEVPWVPMSGADIASTLTGRSVQYETAWQDFRASGRTLYHAGRDSWGYWRVEDDKYCSQWPPQGLWACYGMDRRGDMVRFVGQGDDVTEGRLTD